MIFEQIRTGGDRNFAYLVGDASTKKAAVVDPSNDPAMVLSRAEHHGLEVVYLINTHGHSDHTNGNKHVLSKTDARLIAGGHGGIEDGALLSLGEVELTIMHTPGHTEDGICILAEASGETGKGSGETGRLITGDTLFVGKVGGTGFGADARAEYDSIHQKLMKLPDETEVWPGHDYGVAPTTTIGNERRTNPFILRENFEAFVDLKRNWLAYKTEHGIQ